MSLFKIFTLSAQQRVKIDIIKSSYIIGDLIYFIYKKRKQYRAFADALDESEKQLSNGIQFEQTKIYELSHKESFHENYSLMWSLINWLRS